MIANVFLQGALIQWHYYLFWQVVLFSIIYIHEYVKLVKYIISTQSQNCYAFFFCYTESNYKLFFFCYKQILNHVLTWNTAAWSSGSYLRNYSYFGAVHAYWTCTRDLANAQSALYYNILFNYCFIHIYFSVSLVYTGYTTVGWSSPCNDFDPEGCAANLDLCDDPILSVATCPKTCNICGTFKNSLIF